MKKRLFRLMSLALCAAMLASFPACGTGFKVTGEIEDGRLTVWYSPKYTDLWYHKGSILSDNSYLFTAFPDDVFSVTFTSEDEFNESLSQALLANKGPDLLLAYADEISPKMLDSEMFVNLDPFLDYEDKQVSVRDLNEGSKSAGSDTEISDTVMKREDLLMNIIDQAKYDGKLYFMPFGLGVKTLQGNPGNSKHGCLDLYNNAYTPVEFLTEASKIKPITIDKESYPSFMELPQIKYIFKNFIDYEHKTTRMGEDITYEYFCAYAQSLIDQQNRDIRWMEDHPENWILNSKGERIGSKGTSLDAYNFSFYKVDNSPIWMGINSFSYSEHFPGYVFGAMNNQDQLLLSGAAQPNMPSEYGTKYYIDMNITTVAAIPACSAHPNKAFAYIKTLLSEVYHNSSRLHFSSPNIQCFKSDLEGMGFSEQQIEQNLADIENGKYAWIWMDSKINDLFHDLLYKKDGQYDHLRQIIPTREQWDSLKNKIELYLNE